MHKVRGTCSSCTGKNIYSSSGGAQGKKEKRGQNRTIYIDPAVLDTTPNIDKYTVFHTHKSGFCPKWRRVEQGKGRRRRRRVAMRRQAWQEGSSNSSNHNTNGRQDVRRRVQVQQKLKTETVFFLFLFFQKFLKEKREKV